VATLALEVRELGHQVQMCVPPNFVDWVAGLGFGARLIGTEMRAPRAGPGSAAPAVIPDLITDQFDAIGSAAHGCDLIVGSGADQYAARSVAEPREIPYVIAAYAPISLPSPDLAPPGHAEDSDGPAANLRMWEGARRSWNERSLERANANRARLSLAPVNDAHPYRPSWLAADATLAPAPSTPGLRVMQTGAWILSDTSQLAPELRRPFDDGEPPIDVGSEACTPSRAPAPH
jgi:vancomycin aglycone glucosyltransferase